MDQRFAAASLDESHRGTVVATVRAKENAAAKAAATAEMMRRTGMIKAEIMRRGMAIQGTGPLWPPIYG